VEGMSFFVSIVSAAIVAWLSSLITVNISLNKFRTERWWEKKVEAYSSLLSAIHDAKAFAEENMEADYRGNELQQETVDSIREKSIKADENIYRAMDVDSFYLSKEAVARLKQYKIEVAEAKKQPDWITFLQMEFNATDSCLKEIMELAKNDLKV
jgi:hypothetical protein